MVTDLTHPDEPTTVLCRQEQLRRWVGWSRSYIDKLADCGTLKTKRIGSRRYFYTKQVKSLLTPES